ncbi:hypothetical protein HZS_7023 [Henneguya salminicola]|nr:hypothetical protein HZS_7023 [Henneguya salminicola]
MRKDKKSYINRNKKLLILSMTHLNNPYELYIFCSVIQNTIVEIRNHINSNKISVNIQILSENHKILGRHYSISHICVQLKICKYSTLKYTTAEGGYKSKNNSHEKICFIHKHFL